MNTGVKIGLLGIVASSIISITFGVLELKKNRRMHEQDIELIADGVAAKLKKQPKVKKETPVVEGK